MPSFALINLFRPCNVSLCCKAKTRANAFKSRFQRDGSLRFDGRVPRIPPYGIRLHSMKPLFLFLWLCKALYIPLEYLKESFLQYARNRSLSKLLQLSVSGMNQVNAMHISGIIVLKKI